MAKILHFCLKNIRQCFFISDLDRLVFFSKGFNRDNIKTSPLRLFQGRYVVLIPCCILILISSGCDFFPNPQQKDISIVFQSSDLGDSAFSPNPAIVHFGGTVVWKNNDKLTHSIVGDAKQGICAFKSDGIAPRGTFKKTFSKRVTCAYYCGIHGKAMRGKIIVR